MPEGVHLSRLSVLLGVTKPCGPGLNLLKLDARSGSSLGTDFTITLILRCGQRRSVDFYNIWKSSFPVTTVRRSINTRTSHVESTKEWGWGVPHLTSSGEAISGTWMKHGHRRRVVKEPHDFARPLPFPSLPFSSSSFPKRVAAPAFSSRLILVGSVDAWGMCAGRM